MNLTEVEPNFYEWRFVYEEAYKKQLPAYFRLDLNVNMKTNYKHHSLEWFIEIVNLTNHDNVRSRTYNSISNTYYYALHYKFLPIFGCKVYF